MGVAVGVLALQGDFHAHLTVLQHLGAEVRAVRLPAQLAGLAGLVIPGGESTTIGKLAEAYGLMQPMRNLAAHERGVPLAFARYVVEVFSLAAQEAIILDALDMGADVCVARVSAVMRFHSLSPRLC